MRTKSFRIACVIALAVLSQPNARLFGQLTTECPPCWKDSVPLDPMRGVSANGRRNLNVDVAPSLGQELSDATDQALLAWNNAKIVMQTEFSGHGYA